MRCPDCNKFVAYEEGEPEVNVLDLDDQGNINAEVCITLNCAECGTTLKESSFTLEETHITALEEHVKDNHPELIKDEKNIDLSIFEIQENGVEFTSRTEGKGRGLKTYYGFSLDYAINCTECSEEVLNNCISDDIQASHMDEL